MLLTVLCILLTSCTSNTEADNKAYVVAIGIDENKNHGFDYTFQYALPLNISKSEDEPLTCKTISSTNIYSACDMFNADISKEINLSHLKLIVFNESLAFNGLESFKPMLLSNTEILPSACITISKTDAKDYLENVSSPLELNPAKYYNFAFDEKNSPFSEAFYITNFFEKSDYVIPFTDEGAIVFKDHKAISILSENELPYYKLLAGTMNKFTIDFTARGFSCVITQRKKPFIKVDKNNLNVFITLYLKQELLGSPPKNANALVETKIKQKCLNIIKKSQKKNADILNIKATFRPHFLTIPQYEAFDFQQKYPEIYFDVLIK
jgi:hypothetical protein